MAAWVAFARNGDPNGPGVPHWARFDSAQDNYLAFSDAPGAAQGWRRDALAMLDRFYDSKAKA